MAAPKRASRKIAFSRNGRGEKQTKTTKVWEHRQPPNKNQDQTRLAPHRPLRRAFCRVWQDARPNSRCRGAAQLPAWSAVEHPQSKRARPTVAKNAELASWAAQFLGNIVVAKSGHSRRPVR